jgi:DNA-binding IscR family transcriptional regulator
MDYAENNGSSQTLASAVILEIWQEAREIANSILQKYTLQDLTDKLNARRQLDIMYYI